MLSGYSNSKRKPPAPPLSVVEATTGQLPSLAAIVHSDNLFATLKNMMAKGAGPSAGEDRVELFDMSPREWAGHLRARGEEVLKGTFRPDPTRRANIPKGKGKTRPLDIPSGRDRVLAVAMNTGIRKYLDARFVPYSYGFRPDLSHWNMLAAIKVVAENTQSFFLAVDDVRQAFPSVHIDPLLKDCAKMIPDPGIVGFITAVVGGHDGTTKEGIPQGNPISPALLLVHLHYRHDLPFQGEDYLLLRARYADNLVYLARSMLDGRRALDKSAALLGEVGLHLKGEGGGLVDLRERPLVVCDSDADPEEEIVLLGFTICAKNGVLSYSVPGKTWNKLETKFRETHNEEDPITHAKAILYGWTNACGPALENNLENHLKLILERVRKAGFQRLFPVDSLRERLKGSLARWHALLRDVRTMRRI